jgi:hypothetical protein
MEGFHRPFPGGKSDNQIHGGNPQFQLPLLKWCNFLLPVHSVQPEGLLESSRYASPHGRSRLNLPPKRFPPRRRRVEMAGTFNRSFSEPEPDLALLSARKNFYSESHPGPDDVLLVIEVADSSLPFDREEKLPLYASAGIREVWIVDLTRRSFLAFRRPVGGQYSEHAGHTEGDIAIPGVTEARINISSLESSLFPQYPTSLFYSSFESLAFARAAVRLDANPRMTSHVNADRSAQGRATAR